MGRRRARDRWLAWPAAFALFLGALAQPPLLVHGAAQTSLQVQPASLTFGPQALASASKPQYVTLTSSPVGPVVFTWGISGPFSANDLCGGVVYTFCSMQVLYLPQVLGPETGTLFIYAQGSTIQVPLGGTAVGWERLGGGLASGPGVAGRDPRRLDVFIQGLDNHLWTGSSDPTLPIHWSGWQVLGGIITAEPSAVSWDANRTDVVARGQDGALWHTWFDGTWRGWEFLGGYLIGGPAVVSRGVGMLDVFVQGGDHQLWHRGLANGSWAPWEPLGGQITGSLGAARDGTVMDAFGRGQDGALWHRQFDGSWRDWEFLGGRLIGGPGAVSPSAGRVDVFVRGADNGLWHRWISAGSWSPWTPETGGTLGDPGVGLGQAGQMHVFIKGLDGALWHTLVPS
jgi:hypothetical protein